MEQINTSNDNPQAPSAYLINWKPHAKKLFSLPNWNWMVFDQIRAYHISEKLEKSGEFKSEI